MSLQSQRRYKLLDRGIYQIALTSPAVDSVIGWKHLFGKWACVQYTVLTVEIRLYTVWYREKFEPRIYYNNEWVEVQSIIMQHYKWFHNRLRSFASGHTDN